MDIDKSTYQFLMEKAVKYQKIEKLLDDKKQPLICGVCRKILEIIDE